MSDVPYIMIATPTKDGRVDVNYAVGLTSSCQVLTSAGIRYQLAHASTSSIDNARSILASLFVNSECTHLLFIDDDMVWASDLPLRLLNENVDIVGVAYRKKKDSVEYTVKHGEQIASLEDRPWMVMVDALGMGMTLIRKNVFEKLCDHVPEYQAYESCVKDPLRLYFRHMLIKDKKDGKLKYESEDFHFCRLARDHGFEIWAYVDEKIGHIGRKAFCGSYNEELEREIKHPFTMERERYSMNLIGA